MALTQKALLGTETEVISYTALSALASGSLVAGSAFDNTQGNAGDGYVMCRVTAIITMATGAGANTGFNIWFLKSQDGGTTYESGGTSYTPLRAPDLVIPAPVDTTQRIVMRDVLLPVGKLKALILNNGTGQATKTDTTSAGSHISITPITIQAV